MVTKTVTFESLPKELDLLTKNLESSFDNAIKDYTVTLVSRMYDISPVDTGLYRSNHNVSLDKRSQNTYSITSKDTVVGDAASKVNEFNSLRNEFVYIQNNLDYAEKLENGGSNQAPAGIYGQAISGGKFNFKMKGG